MGLDKDGTKYLLYAKSVNVDFTRTAMIGRQELHLKKKELMHNLSEYDYKHEDINIKTIFDEYDGYAEGFLKYLGAVDIHSYDNSNYEGATHIHDMNMPVSESYKNQYSIVIDGGSLEHVFNFPNAIKNCMEMVKVGGHFISITPTNNLVGHGFYQFSPELFYRVLSSENGFAVVSMILVECRKRSKWYSVIDPDELGDRVTLENKKQTYLMILAKKIKDCGIFENAPQQSDYAKIWDATDLHNYPKKIVSYKHNYFIRKLRKIWRKTPFHIPGPKDNPEFYVPFDESKISK